MRHFEDYLLYVDHECSIASAYANFDTAVKRRNIAKALRERIVRGRTIIRITVTKLVYL